MSGASPRREGEAEAEGCGWCRLAKEVWRRSQPVSCRIQADGGLIGPK